MLRFDQFRKFNEKLESELARQARQDEYDRFYSETLAKFNKDARTVEDLDDESYPKFLDELKSYRVSRKINEGCGARASEDPQLEAFRADCIDCLHRQAGRVRFLVSEEIGHSNFELYAAGSVVDPTKFSDSSDVDMAVVAQPALTNETVMTLRRKLCWGFTFGALDVVSSDKAAPDWIKL